MTTDVWKPSVTVAAIIERDGRFLMIEEHAGDGLRLNQPAGHLEQGESLIQAVIRETMEESAHDFTPTALVGMYMSRQRVLFPRHRPRRPICALRLPACLASAMSVPWTKVSCVRSGCHVTNWRLPPFASQPAGPAMRDDYIKVSVRR